MFCLVLLCLYFAIQSNFRRINFLGNFIVLRRSLLLDVDGLYDLNIV